jgi:hypothetical protein
MRTSTVLGTGAAAAPSGGAAAVVLPPKAAGSTMPSPVRVTRVRLDELDAVDRREDRRRRGTAERAAGQRPRGCRA